jgi:hypothetical protein
VGGSEPDHGLTSDVPREWGNVLALQVFSFLRRVHGTFAEFLGAKPVIGQ